MRWKYFATSLFLYPLFTFADNDLNSSIFFDTADPIAANTIERSLSNENNIAAINQTPIERSMDYPTQVIRMSKPIENHQLTCAQVNAEIDKIFISKITKDKFSYTTYISCTYDPETKIAVKFAINSYFDPINDEGVDYLNTYLDQYNGSDLLGTAFTIESAKALIVSLNLSVGMKKNPNMPPFIEYREDRSNYYFKSNYELQINLIADVGKRFFSDEPEKVLPFLDIAKPVYLPV